METSAYSHTIGGNQVLGKEKCPDIRPNSRPPSPNYPVVSRVLRAISDGPVLDFETAFNFLGPERLPSLYDMACIKKLFVDAGCGCSFSEYGGPSGDLSGIERPYFWTGETLGIAPEGHPAKGKVILAKIVGVRSETETQVVTQSLFGETGDVIPSENDYTICKDLVADRGGVMITGFIEQDGFMVPVTGVDSDNAKGQITEYGPLLISDSNMQPVSFRPSSWHCDLTFTFDACSSIYRVIRRDWLRTLGVLS